MPQKLIRLTSTTGDGVFDTIFNEEVVIPEKSEIALQSLTLERRSKTFTLNNLNNTIRFQAVGNGSANIPTNTGNVEPTGLYSNQNDITLLNQLRNCLNQNSSMITTPSSMNIQFNVESVGTGNVVISAKPSPLYPLTATAAHGMFEYYNLFGGNVWSEEDDGGKSTDATFKTTNTGRFAKFRKTNTDGDPANYWQPVDGNVLAWKIYNSKPTAPNGTPDATATMDAAGKISIDGAGDSTTFTPTTAPTIIPQKNAAPLSFLNLDTPLQYGIDDAEAANIGAFQVGEYGCYRDKDSTASGNINECYMYGDFPLIKSTGSFRVRLKRLINALGEDSAIMGIVKGTQGLAKLRGANIADTDFEYAIKFKGRTEEYQYKIGTDGTYTNSGYTPINFDVANTANANDVIEICLDNGNFIGIVNQNSAVGGGGTDSARQMPPQPFDTNEDYYFVLCLLENKENIVFDNIGVSLDAYGSELLGPPPRLIDTYLPSTDSFLTTLIEYDGIVTANETDFSNGRLDFAALPDLGFAVTKNNSLANFLGFPLSVLSNKFFGLGTELVLSEDDEVINKTLQNPNSLPFVQEYKIQNGFTWTAPNIYALASHPQNLLIETQTFTLDSYDSYGLDQQQRTAKTGGSRRNILATIPSQAVEIAGTANALLQFQPATLNYIAIKNRGDVTTRQLKFRLLTSTYGNVEVEDMAVLVILVKSP